MNYAEVALDPASSHNFIGGARAHVASPASLEVCTSVPPATHAFALHKVAGFSPVKKGFLVEGLIAAWFLCCFSCLIMYSLPHRAAATKAGVKSSKQKQRFDPLQMDLMALVMVIPNDEDPQFANPMLLDQPLLV
ncbi:hypothetical protein AMTR_s00116p00137450 [Amborella trichopoda]|uniref:Uncharacterized protein n=1 Tax=Amborella trichopoda TaxID=13333 RepID=W1NQP9_AMBTC|nr:hypothetical protein AMTR_s00116p00137450 [Amborella trichopoda]